MCVLSARNVYEYQLLNVPFSAQGSHHGIPSQVLPAHAVRQIRCRSATPSTARRETMWVQLAGPQSSWNANPSSVWSTDITTVNTGLLTSASLSQ
eukprot:scaffold182858_cov36-Tisochrysis_lutea.AAC.4